MSSFLKGLIYTVLLATPLLAFVVSESTLFPYITGRNFMFRTMIEIALISYVYLAVKDVTFRPKKSIVFTSYLAFISIIFLANVLGLNPYLSFFSSYERMEGWFTHLHLFLYFTLLFGMFKTDTDWKKMFGMFSVSSVLVTVFAFFQLIGQKDFFVSNYFATKFSEQFGMATSSDSVSGFVLSSNMIQLVNAIWPVSQGNGLRPDSTLGNAAYSGVFSMMLVFVFAFMSYKAKKWKGEQSWGTFAGILLSAFFLILGNGVVKIAQYMVQSSDTAQTVLKVGGFVNFISWAAIIYFAYSFVKKSAQDKIGSWVFVFLSLLNMIFLYYTQTRGSYLGLIGGIMVAGLYVIFAGRAQYKKLAIASGAVIVTFILSLTLLFTFKDSSIVKNSVALNRLATIKAANIISNPAKSIEMIANHKYTYPELLEYFGEATIVSRFLNAGIVIDGINDSWKTVLLGVGQENYIEIFAKHYDSRMYQQEPWFDRAHNVFMDWLIAGGLLGLISYLALYLTPVYLLAFRKNNLSVVERALLIGAFVAYFIHNMFVFDYLISYIIFFTLLAYTAWATSDETEYIFKKVKLNKWGEQSIIAVTGVVAVLMFVYLVAKPLNTNLDIIAAYRSSYLSTPETFASSTDKTLSYFKSAVERNSFGKTEAVSELSKTVMSIVRTDFTQLPTSTRDAAMVSANAYAGYSLNTLSNYSASTTDVKIKSSYGVLLYSIGQTEEALKIFAEINKIAPMKTDINLNYARMLIQANKNKEALDVVKKLYEGDSSNKEVADVYKQLSSVVK